MCDTGKTITLTRWTFVGRVMSLLFNMLSRLIIAFLPRSKHLLISWLQSPFAVILEAQKIKSGSFHCFPVLFAMKWWDWMPWSSFTECWGFFFFLFFFECWVLSQLFQSSFTLIKRLSSFSSLSAVRVLSFVYLRLLMCLPAILKYCPSILLIN